MTLGTNIRHFMTNSAINARSDVTSRENSLYVRTYVTRPVSQEIRSGPIPRTDLGGSYLLAESIHRNESASKIADSILRRENDPTLVQRDIRVFLLLQIVSASLIFALFRVCIYNCTLRDSVLVNQSNFYVVKPGSPDFTLSYYGMVAALHCTLGCECMELLPVGFMGS